MATLADELLNDFEDSGSEIATHDLDDHHQDDIINRRRSATNDTVDPSQGDGPDDTSDRENNRSHDTISEAGIREDRDVRRKRNEMEDADSVYQHEKFPSTNGTTAHGDEDAPDEDATKDKVERMKLGGVGDVRSVAGLMKRLRPVLESIRHYQSSNAEDRTTVTGSIEENPEYKLLTQSNSLSTLIDAEIILVHKFIRDHYSARFPELETLITNPLDYAKTVAVLGNGPLDNIKALASSAENLVGVPLKTIIDAPSLMVVTVEGTTTKGREISPKELRITLQACEMAIELERTKTVLTEYVQSRMNVFAPNLTALIGSLTAAQLLNYTGGVTGLAKTPSCNLAALGSKKQTQTGFASNVRVRQQGYLYQSPIIQEIPADLRKQAMRIVSAKLILAARVDRMHESPDGSTGADLRQSCLDRLEKLTEPPPNKGPRALPAPDDKPSRKRGGRRARKAKEATAMTDLRKAQNRLAFGKEEKEVGYGTGEGTKGLGMIGQENDGRIRAGQVDQRTRAKLSKKNSGWGRSGVSGVGSNHPASSSINGLASSLKSFGSSSIGPGTGTSLRSSGLRTAGVNTGTASSIAFTPVQGLELVDPKVQAELNRKRKAEEDRWFTGGTFTQVGSGVSGGGGGSGKDVSSGNFGEGSGGGGTDGVFKRPQLPASKIARMPAPSS